ncbi:MAG: hypothetical protein Q7R30_17260 [Acidobacteriota bacterium]|nr:hypothetical protein [Acidobacteriota bacterium]
MARGARPVLTLVAERALRELIQPPKDSNVLEASGVVAKGGYYYVIFDNIRRIARLHRSLEPGSKKHAWFGRTREGDGYEDIAYSPQTRRFYLLIEAEKHPDGTYKALIDECDENAGYKKRRWIDFTFEKRNTGMEGLSVIRVNGRDYLLALCEGNGCHGGRKGTKPGSGRIHVLRRVGRVWKPMTTIALPPSVKFEDYSAVAVRGNKIAVISQQDSRLWIGTLRIRRPRAIGSEASDGWKITGRGTIYDFPRTKKGKHKYCTLEGLCWLSPRTFVLVSDLSKGDYSKRCRKHDQSIHVFRLP